MKKTRMIGWLLLLIMSLVLIAPSMTFASSKVYHVPIEGEVEKGLQAFLQRAFNEALKNNAEAIVLEIHTPGGFTDAADEIAKLMDQARSKLKVIAFINTKAHSAGAFLALHADEIYMMPSATIGAAGIIDSAGNAAEEKAQSAWIAQMKAAAESSGRKPIYAEAMANKNIDMEKYRAPVGKFLTLSAEEAKEVKYSNGTVHNMQEVLEHAGLANSEVIDLNPMIAEKIVRIITNPVVVPILLSIASLGLVLELYSPGFGVPGIMGLSSLGLFFFGHTIAGFAGYETIILFVVGLALLIAELFIPGGIIGIIGGALMIISLLFAGANFVHMAYSILIAMFIAVIGMVIIMKFFGKKLHVFNKLVLKDATTTEEGYVSNVNRIELIGKIGTALTPLRPAGVISVGAERIDAVSEGSYIDVEKKVEVIKVEGSRIVVREYKEKAGE
ncbi:nodulation protein NfeD [Solibacillus sp. CAU 1738]|uniref:NfeD family protein n=1 Tax=Solibacillus sp. CAU 1738 TaxID=3140363 RepID=UPI003260F839